jgi:plastocyanin
MMNCRVGLTLFMAAWAVSSLWGLRLESAPSAMKTVAIEGMRFIPDLVQVRIGERIEFKNLDLVPHTVTSASGIRVESGIIEPGKAWTLTCAEAGEISYHCNFHQAMTGKIKVINQD